MRLVIIDGNSLLFRAYFAMRPMVTKDGQYTQGVFAFINMLQKILKDYEPDHVAVCFDMKAKTFRHLKYPEYKAGRQKTPVELLSQVPLMHRVLEAMNIRVFELETFEADDLIGTVTARAESEGIESLVITGDKDALQLVGEKTRVVINKRGMTEFDLYDLDAMQERYGLTPTQFIDLKGLMGDKSDNIPGIPGIGEKKGIALLENYGSVEGVVAHADEIKGKMGENVRANIESAIMSKDLATIKRDVPMDFSMDELLYREPDYDKLIEVYRELEFNSFINKLLKNDEAVVMAEDDQETLAALDEVKTVEEAEFFSQVEAGSSVVIHVDTDNNHVSEPQISGYALYSPEKKLYTERPLTAFDSEAAMRALQEKEYKLTGYVLKDVVYSMLRYGITGLVLEHDVEVAEYLIDPNRSKYTLDKMLVKYSSLTYQEDADQRTLLFYIGLIAGAQHEQMEKDELLRVFDECEMPLIETMAAMEHAGMQVEREVLEKTGVEQEARIRELEAKIYEDAGKEFNINSPKQLGVILFEDMGIPYPKKKGKSWSTAVDVLEKLVDEYPIVQNVLEYRKAAKLKSTYIDGLTTLIADDGRIHPHFNQTVAATGRISCTEPNLQNIPIRSEEGRNIRKAFVAPDEDHTLIGADYSQIELRILAAFSGDESMISSFEKGEDIHRRTASRVFEIPMEEVTALDRSRAKAVNFGVIYGMSGFGLSENLMITRAEAQRYIDEYFDKHAAVKEYMDQLIEIGERDHAVRTLLGRIRQIPEFTSRKFMERQLANRLAMNTPIQGSAADIIKLAMNSVYRELRDKGYKSKLILQIHDELIIEATNDELEAVEELLRRNMENAVDLKVKLLCDIHAGSTWYDLK